MKQLTDKVISPLDLLAIAIIMPIIEILHKLIVPTYSIDLSVVNAAIVLAIVSTVYVIVPIIQKTFR